MGKWLVVCFLLHASVYAFEKLDPKYRIAYGDPQAKVQIVEYFSFSCPKCFEFFVTDFPSIKEKYLKTGKISWTFHPDPADLLTLQALICLEKLDEKQKIVFFEAVTKNLVDLKLKHGCVVMQGAMEVFKHPLPELDKIDFVMQTEACKAAVKFLKQKDVVASIPTLEIGGRICDEYPTVDLVAKLFREGAS